jgi:hypothetical protein
MIYFYIHFPDGCFELLEEEDCVTVGDLAKQYGHIRKAKFARGCEERFRDFEDLDNSIVISELLAHWRDMGIEKDWVILGLTPPPADPEPPEPATGPFREPIVPLPAFELTAPFSAWHQEAINLLGEEAHAAVESHWHQLCDDNTRSLKSKVRILLDFVISRSGKTNQLYTKVICERDLAETLYGKVPLPDRTVLLDLAPSAAQR